MTTERAGQTANDYLCRWGCGNTLIDAGSRYRHEINAHGGVYTGTLAAEVGKLKAEIAKLQEAAGTALKVLEDAKAIRLVNAADAYQRLAALLRPQTVKAGG